MGKMEHILYHVDGGWVDVRKPTELEYLMENCHNKNIRVYLKTGRNFNGISCDFSPWFANDEEDSSFIVIDNDVYYELFAKEIAKIEIIDNWQIKQLMKIGCFFHVQKLITLKGW